MKSAPCDVVCATSREVEHVNPKSEKPSESQINGFPRVSSYFKEIMAQEKSMGNIAKVGNSVRKHTKKKGYLRERVPYNIRAVCEVKV